MTLEKMMADPEFRAMLKYQHEKIMRDRYAEAIAHIRVLLELPKKFKRSK